MPITPNNILAHEWIGLRVSIIDSADPNLKGISGLVLNETKNTFAMVDKARTVKIAKSNTVFATTLPSGETLTVPGNRLRYRPEDRVKRGLRRW
ncbi:MAG TPA: ribonuclease P protein component 1 [Candidatus Dormibacteraeota bacterium]|jgi:RNase P/RNase MRP subunit p29|nr:ribonuclease P protein component 1 [Candidatus Dormibacteraeota bacterium]